MISSLFTTSRKAWVAGLVAIVLTPLVQLLASDATITWRTALYALINGVLSGLAVYAVENEKSPGVLAAEKRAVQTAATTAVHAIARTGVDITPLQTLLTVELPAVDDTTTDGTVGNQTVGG